MSELATKVREALIEQRAEDLYQFFTNPQYKPIIAELVEVGVNSIVEMVLEIGNDFFDEEDREKLREGYSSQLNAAFSNPEQLRSIVYEQARTAYQSEEEFRTKLESHSREMRKEDDVGDNIVNDYAKSYDGILESARMQDKIVDRLAQIAESEGLEKALQKETRYGITREIFTTADEYRAAVKKVKEVIKRFFKDTQDALARDGETGKMMSKGIGVMGNIVERSLEIGERIQEDYLEKEIQAIYGGVN